MSFAEKYSGLVELNYPMADHFTFGIGGSADRYIQPSSESELVEALALLHESQERFWLHGSGSNVLLRDGGFRGTVIHLCRPDFSNKVQKLDGAEGVFRFPSAMLKAHALDWSLKNNFAGLEFSAGIPGTLGGAVFMNAGTRWGSYVDVLRKIRLWHPTDGIVEKTPQDLGMRYRGHDSAVFDQGAVVLSVDMQLEPRSSNERSKALVSMILSYRGGRQPLEWPNCGSVFKNPEGQQLGAGRMIEACGLKGRRIGGAQISEQHANFILNVGRASSADVESLMKLVQDEVLKKFEVLLEPELIVVGEATEGQSS